MSSSPDAPSTRPSVDSKFVEPALAGWAHRVVEPSFLQSSDADKSPVGSIFLGPQQSAGKDALSALSRASPPVTGIVNCTNAFANAHAGSIDYCCVAVNDECGANILVYLDGATRFIDHHVKSGGSVLVHCQMGVSRSATVVIAYLMRYKAMSREEAYLYVKERRPMINPNPGFWNQLQLYYFRLSEKARQRHEMQVTTFNKDWAEESLATFQTIGHVVENKSELFPEVTAGTDITKVLFVAVDYVFGRGILEADLPWLGAICASCFSEADEDPVPIIDSLLSDGSDFSELWSGEIYPDRVDKIKSAVAGQALKP